jgi:uncharacterized membrane protein (DUF106 family)
VTRLKTETIGANNGRVGWFIMCSDIFSRFLNHTEAVDWGSILPAGFHNINFSSCNSNAVIFIIITVVIIITVFIYLFISGLFNDNVSNSDHIASNERINK